MSDRLLKAVHETATGLYETGVIDAVTVRELDALCLPPIKQYRAAQIRIVAVRRRVAGRTRWLTAAAAGSRRK